jgi:lysine-N-methylase
MKYKSHIIFEDFNCLKSECPDPCCRGWRVAVDNTTLELYQKKAPSLLNYVEKCKDNKLHFLKQSSEQGNCLNFKGGLCQIHAQLGEEYLPNTCFLYPKVLKKVGDLVFSFPALSCPETSRLYFLEDENSKKYASSFIEKTLDRKPQELANYSTGDTKLDESDGIAILEEVMKFVSDTHLNTVHILLKLFVLGEVLERNRVQDWKELVKLHLYKLNLHKPEAIPPSELQKHNLVILSLTLSNINYLRKEQATELRDLLAFAYGLSFSEANQTIVQHSSFPLDSHLVNSEDKIKTIEYILKKWTQLQVASSLFPFKKPGENLTNIILVIILKYLSLRMVLFATAAAIDKPAISNFIRHIQMHAKAFDHIKDSSPMLEYAAANNISSYEEVYNLLINTAKAF